MRVTIYIRISLSIVTILLWQSASAQDTWQHCGNLIPFILPKADESLDQGKLSVTADSTEFDAKGIYRFSGNVLIQQDGQVLLADHASYDESDGSVIVQGKVRYLDEDFVLMGEQGMQGNMQDYKGSMSYSDYFMKDRHARGSASSLELVGPGILHLSNASYTTCNPGDDAWYLKTGELNLWRDKSLGVARNVRVEFMHVPFFYTPYIDFSLGARKSGLFMPTYVSDDINGRDISVPYYWNIAPNLDDTFTLRYMSNRGSQVQNEFRYLTKNSSGTLYQEYLANDALKEETREYLVFDHGMRLTPRWTASLHVRRVSDDTYFRDLSEDNTLRRTVHLLNYVDSAYQGTGWNLRARADQYQSLDGSDQYRRQPQINFASSGRLPYSEWSLSSEYVRFDRDTGLTGSRMDIMAVYDIPVRRAGYFLVPAYKWRFTGYELSDPLYSDHSDPNRIMGWITVDSGLYLERDYNIGQRQFLHTLEPRLFYARIPYRDQRDLPLFDTGLSPVGLAQMFRDNRYNGADRIGDTEHVGFALTSRWLDDASGSEWLNFSLAQLFYLKDRLVGYENNPDNPDATSELSDIQLNLTINRFSHWRLVSSALLAKETYNDLSVNHALQYKNGSRVFNINYSFVRGVRETMIYSMAWPVSQSWSVYGRLIRNEMLDYTDESLIGAQYGSCCWSVRLLMDSQALDDRIVINNDGSVDVSYNNSIWIQLELKGLTDVGRKIDDLLAKSIDGYEKDLY